MFARILFGLLLIVGVNTANALEFPPRPIGFVNDFAGMMNQTERDTLNQKLAQFKNASRVNIVITTITSAADYNYSGLVELGVALFDRWKPGEASIDSGILIIIAGTSPPFKIRIVTGRGMEGAVPDAVAKRIIEDKMKPVMHTKVSGAYANGLTLGIEQLMERTKDEFAPKTKALANDNGDNLKFIPFVVIALSFILAVIIIWSFYRSIRRKEQMKEPEWREEVRYAPPSQPRRSVERSHRAESSSPPPAVFVTSPVEEERSSSFRDNDSSDSSDSSMSMPDFGGSTAGGGAGDD